MNHQMKSIDELNHTSLAKQNLINHGIGYKLPKSMNHPSKISTGSSKYNIHGLQ